MSAASSWVSSCAPSASSRLACMCSSRRPPLHAGELVRAISVIKAYAAEAAWGERIAAAREAELRQLKALRYLGALITLACALH